MSEFVKWQSIERFQSMFKYANRFKPAINHIFRTKIKLHGTNASLTFTKDGVIGGKRTGFVSIEKDNAGFARWTLNTFHNKPVNPELEGYIFYGEWAGKGVQKTDAVSQIENKCFFIFTAKNEEGHRIYEPDEIEKLVEKAGLSDNSTVKVIPWFDNSVELNLHDSDQCQEYFEKMVDQVDQIAKEDPYIKSEFDISGPGEGLVGYCISDPDSQLLFKVKTENHSVQKVKDRKSIKIEFSPNTKAFVDQFFTEARFEQIRSETISDDLEMKQLGKFIKDVVSDVQKESLNELAESPDVEWKDIVNMGVSKVKSWFITEVHKL